MAHRTLYRVEATGTRTKINEHRSLAENFTAGQDAVHAHAENAYAYGDLGAMERTH